MHRSLLLTLRQRKNPLWVIFEINFLRNLAVASLTSIFALYMRKFVSSDSGVAIILLGGYLAAFISNLYSGVIISHLKKKKTLILAIIALTFLFALFTQIKHSAAFFLIFAIYQFAISLFIMDVILYVKHYSNFREIAENAGKLGSFSNIGWIIGPLLGSLIADKFGFEMVFYFSAILSSISLLRLFFAHIADEEIHFHHQKHFFQNIKLFFARPNLRKTYINNAGLGFIYSIWDYLPLMMFGLGATIPIIGLTKTLMGINQSIFEFPIGQMADKQTGERRLFIVGYLLAAIFTLVLGFTTDLRIFITFFFIAAIGTSFLEMTRDSYFFRQMPEKDVEMIGVYRTSDSLPYLIGEILAIIIISLFSVKMWFIIGGAIAILFAFNAWRMKEIKTN